MVVSEENVKSFRKGQAIHRPEGWIVSSRSKLKHLTEGKMTEQEYLAFDYLLHLAGWDKRKENFGKVPRNITRLQQEWFTFWSRPTLIKAIKGLATKRYIEDDGQWLVIPNFAKYQDKSNRNAVNDFDSEEENTVNDFDSSDQPTVNAVDSGVNAVDSHCQRGLQQVSTPLTVDPPQTRTITTPCDPKPINQLKPKENNNYAQHFDVLQGVKGYPFDAETDGKLLAELERDFSEIDLLTALKEWATRKMDEPLTSSGKGSKPRAQIRTWITNARRFGKPLKSETKTPAVSSGGGVVTYGLAPGAIFGWG